MKNDATLGAFEELVLLAVAHERDDAYGMRVRREIERRAGRDVAIGAVYATLDRLEDKGLVASVRADDVSSRARRFFHVTAEGARALLDAAALHRRMWADIDENSLAGLADRRST
jgi:PadR family transcriptional regulator PadR